MDYAIHLYVPKTGTLTPKMVEWLYQNGQSVDQPEIFWPVRKIIPRKLGRILYNFDKSLIPKPAPNQDVEFAYPMEQLGLRLYLHERGVIIGFLYMGGGLARITLGIVYTYIRFLYENAGFWSYDPQLNVISYADDFQSIDETAQLMDELLPKMLSG